ncbi:hypothetical protein F4775DRAFT_577772 [Biscogniauxia sp. FL1348]|nr:hypothetical protein F4775DRAFT_577772 [Biscogniauxia sp. FL1348]
MPRHHERIVPVDAVLVGVLPPPVVVVAAPGVGPIVDDGLGDAEVAEEGVEAGLGLGVEHVAQHVAEGDRAPVAHGGDDVDEHRDPVADVVGVEGALHDAGLDRLGALALAGRRRDLAPEHAPPQARADLEPVRRAPVPRQRLRQPRDRRQLPQLPQEVHLPVVEPVHRHVGPHRRLVARLVPPRDHLRQHRHARLPHRAVLREQRRPEPAALADPGAPLLVRAPVIAVQVQQEVLGQEPERRKLLELQQVPSAPVP